MVTHYLIRGKKTVDRGIRIEYHGPSIIEADTKREARKIAMEEVDITIWEDK